MKTLPGMERRINEHIVSFHFPVVPDCNAAAAGGSDFSCSLAQSQPNPAEVSAVRRSFGHRVPAAAEDDLDRVPGHRRILNSESFHSVVGMTTGTSQGGKSIAWNYLGQFS